MNTAKIEQLKLFAQMRKENVKPKSIKNILGISDDEYDDFKKVLNACHGASGQQDHIQPDLFRRSRKYVADFLLRNPFRFQTTEEVAQEAEVSVSTVQRAFRDFPEIKNLLLKDETRNILVENVGFHKRTTKKAIDIIVGSYFDEGKKIKPEELTSEVGFSRKACQSFLTRFPHFAVLVDKTE